MPPKPSRRSNVPNQATRQECRSDGCGRGGCPRLRRKRRPQHRPRKGPRADKLSALDAAAKVLEETGQPMTCQEMIDAMAKKGYWSSPGGRTPAATLYSAILRELKAKGDQCRFVKTERGKFARK